jgi:hypothetical protein
MRRRESFEKLPSGWLLNYAGYAECSALGRSGREVKNSDFY